MTNTVAQSSARTPSRTGYPPIGALLEVVGFCDGCGTHIFQIRNESRLPGGWYSRHRGDCPNMPSTGE